MKSVQKIKKISFILDNQSDWQERGRLLKSLRESEGLSRNHVAIELGISHGRLRRFESGQPVLDAKLIEYAYNHYLHVRSLLDRGYCNGDNCEK